jgi:pyrroline-5-carboxylate reductase
MPERLRRNLLAVLPGVIETVGTTIVVVYPGDGKVVSIVAGMHVWISLVVLD